MKLKHVFDGDRLMVNMENNHLEDLVIVGQFVRDSRVYLIEIEAFRCEFPSCYLLQWTCNLPRQITLALVTLGKIRRQ
jgi:hypothetical protein